MNDPWNEFVRRSEGRESVGYFESAPRRPTGVGSCVSFTAARQVHVVRPGEPAERLVRTVDRFVSSGPHRAALGYLGFDAVGLFEPALRAPARNDPFPLGMFALVDRPTRARVPRRPRRAVIRFSSPGRPLDDSLPASAFGRSVRRLIEDIRNGEAYQVVLSHRRSWRRPDDLVARAGALRASERFAFFYYLRFGDIEIVGATPESVAEVDGRRAGINPIAGTIPRGRQRKGRRPLAVDPKELAEHRMLVDLARNDLGAVADPGSVRLRSRERVERFARLSHLVTRVSADLPRRVGPWQVLRAAFPAGTVTGAPKIRATQLLRREEQSWRGVYAGTVGLVGPGRRATWALSIRTAFAAGSRLYTAAGAGIVQRSEPRREFEETLVKLAHVEASLAGGPA
jgi:anthranilate/para-aminobenzoate synthase component I